MKYGSDYALIGQINPRWIPDFITISKMIYNPVLTELIENGNHYYNLILDYDLERCKEEGLNIETECMPYINNYINEVERLKKI